MRPSPWIVLLPLAFLSCSDDEEPSSPKTASGGSAGASGTSFASGGGTGGTASGGRGMGGSAGTSAGTSGTSGTGGATSGGSGGAGRGGSSGATTGGSGGSGGTPTTGPDCTQSFDGAATLAQIGQAINSAGGGAVLCVERGATYTGSLNVNNDAPTAENRVLVCAAAPGGTECSSDGGANPVFEGSGIRFDADSDGFVFRNIDIVCGSNCGVGVELGGASHLRFEGGVVSGWDQAFECNSFLYDEPCDDIEIGAPDNPTEVTENTNGFFGWLSNSFIRIDAHDNGDGTVFTHHWYLSSGPQDAPSTNVVFENGRYTRSSVSGGESLGTFLNLSGQNQDIIIRNNLFEDDSCSTYVVDCSSGGEDPEEFCDGIEVYGNTFRTNCAVELYLTSTQRARVYNNVFESSGELMTMENGERPASDGWFFNNTVVCPGGCETAVSFVGDNNRFFNNLLHYASGGSIVGGGSGACARFGGGNGPNFTNNFLYAPGSSPRLPACGSDNSTSFSSDPGFADAAAGDFRIGASSPAAGFGTPTNAPETDFDGTARPSPPSAGAFDVN